jgi:hypothetical protein
VGISGGDVTGDPSSAAQDVRNKANADASNGSTTNQTANPTQTGGGSDPKQKGGSGSHCWSGCGGNGQEQNVIQWSETKQKADADAKAKQNAVNANAPIGTEGGGMSGDPSADQTAKNKADADASNSSTTNQTAMPKQEMGGSWCWSGCGGNGQEQNVFQGSETKQKADSDAKAKQDAINANVPVLAVGGDPKGDPSSATQDAKNKADADASNGSTTNQTATPKQTAGISKCGGGCGGGGQEQNTAQWADTKQHSDADAKARQKALNVNLLLSLVAGRKEHEAR